jgi:hypothetical protein
MEEKKEVCKFCGKDLGGYNHYGHKRIFCICGVYCSEKCLNKYHDKMENDDKWK